MKYPVTDIISAPISEEVENFRYDYTDPAGQLDENTLTRARYGLTFALSFVLIFLRLYISLFGRRMRNEGLRWHSIFISIFSLIQLFIFADTASLSPWYDYLRDVFIIKHVLSIEQITLSAFPASISFLIPIYLVTYLFPSLRQTFFFKWFIWIFIYGGLTVFSIYGFQKYKESLDGTATLPIDPLIGYYQFIACNGATFSVLFLLLSLMLGYLCMFSYAIVNCKNPDRNTMKKKIKDNGNLFMITAYILIVSSCNVPKNLINLSNFYLFHIMPYFQQKATYMPNENPGESLKSIFKYADPVNSFLNFIPTTQLIFPVVEFVAASIFLQMYRENMINLLSCGVFYHDDANGSVWKLVPNRYRTVRPLEATPFNGTNKELPNTEIDEIKIVNGNAKLYAGK